MRAAFNNGSILEHQNQIRIADSIQAVRDHDARAAQRRKMPVHLRFGDGVQGTGGFIEEQDGRAVHQRPCQRYPLPLPAGQGTPTIQEQGFVPHRHGNNVLVDAGQLGGLHHLREWDRRIL